MMRPNDIPTPPPNGSEGDESPEPEDPKASDDVVGFLPPPPEEEELLFDPEEDEEDDPTDLGRVSEDTPNQEHDMTSSASDDQGPTPAKIQLDKGDSPSEPNDEFDFDKLGETEPEETGDPSSDNELIDLTSKGESSSPSEPPSSGDDDKGDEPSELDEEFDLNEFDFDKLGETEPEEPSDDVAPLPPEPPIGGNGGDDGGDEGDEPSEPKEPEEPGSPSEPPAPKRAPLPPEPPIGGNGGDDGGDEGDEPSEPKEPEEPGSPSEPPIGGNGGDDGGDEGGDPSEPEDPEKPAKTPLIAKMSMIVALALFMTLAGVTLAAFITKAVIPSVNAMAGIADFFSDEGDEPSDPEKPTEQPTGVQRPHISGTVMCRGPGINPLVPSGDGGYVGTVPFIKGNEEVVHVRVRGVLIDHDGHCVMPSGVPLTVANCLPRQDGQLHPATADCPIREALFHTTL